MMNLFAGDIVMFDDRWWIYVGKKHSYKSRGSRNYFVIINGKSRYFPTIRALSDGFILSTHLVKINIKMLSVEDREEYELVIKRLHEDENLYL